MKKTILATKTVMATALAAAALAPMAAEAQNHHRSDRGDHHQSDRHQNDRHRGGDRGDRHENGRDDRNDRNDHRLGQGPNRYGNHNAWNNRNHRENWQTWRNTHRDQYRRGNWRAPFRYRSFGIGMFMPRAYWGSQYYFNNWDDYRLPAPGWHRRYVRHYDDLLLIDTRNGRIVRVYRNFFW